MIRREAQMSDKTTSDKTTFVSFLLDETGSMESIKDDTVGGFNEYVKTLGRDGADILFSLVSFNSSETRRRYVAEPIANVAPLAADDYVPRAMTPLIDAAVKIIKATDEAVRKRGDQPNVVIVVQTDGQENVSVEYTSADLAALVKEKEGAGWQFVFLGAGLDAFAAAREAGIDIPLDHVMSYSRHRSRQVFASTAKNVREFADSGAAERLSFTPGQREDAGDEHAHRYLGWRPARTGSGGGRSGRSGPGRTEAGASRPASDTRSVSHEGTRKSTAEDYDLS
jgi:hypothetical protein